MPLTQEAIEPEVESSAAVSPKRLQKRSVLSVGISPSMREELLDLADQSHMSLSEYVRAALLSTLHDKAVFELVAKRVEDSKRPD